MFASAPAHQTFNDGIWTTKTSTSDRLRVKNSSMALNQLRDRAKMPFLVNSARKAANTALAANVRNALAAKGHADL